MKNIGKERLGLDSKDSFEFAHRLKLRRRYSFSFIFADGLLRYAQDQRQLPLGVARLDSSFFQSCSHLTNRRSSWLNYLQAIGQGLIVYNEWWLSCDFRRFLHKHNHGLHCVTVQALGLRFLCTLTPLLLISILFAKKNTLSTFLIFQDRCEGLFAIP